MSISSNKIFQYPEYNFKGKKNDVVLCTVLKNSSSNVAPCHAHAVQRLHSCTVQEHYTIIVSLL